MIVGSVLIPRFSLLSAVADRTQMLTEPVALSPEPGGEQAVGEVSGAAEAFGIHAGMQLGEALGRCPRLALVPADPGRASSDWERIVRSLERIGAEVESDRAGEAFFGVDALRGLWGPRHEDVLVRAWRAVGRPARVAGAPTRFCALAAARAGGRGRRRRTPRVVPAGSEREFLAPQPVRLLDGRLGTSRGPDRSRRLIATLERLGVETLGELAEMPRIAIADRFGALGLRAHDLASGMDTPLRPRRPHEELIQAVGLPEAAYGAQLERALELLIERLLADPRREGRAIRSLRLEARLAEGEAGPRMLSCAAPAARPSDCDWRLCRSSPDWRHRPPPSPCGRWSWLPAGPCRRRSLPIPPSDAGSCSPRRCGRCGPPRAATRSCACSWSIRDRGCRSAGQCSLRTTRPRRELTMTGLYAPKAIRVEAAAGLPASIAGSPVEAVRERWLVEDRWWSSDQLRRDYFEVVLASGRCTVVFRDLETDRWYEQR